MITNSAEPPAARELAERTTELAATVAGELGCERELGHVAVILEQD